MSKTILIAPLNWGLGHATRCIPIIHQFLEDGATPCIASDGAALLLLKKEFPSLVIYELPSYNIQYRYETMLLNAIIQFPKVWQAIRAEQLFIQNLLKEKHFDMIISDNRYGCYSYTTKSILITHQLNIIAPSIYFQPFINYANQQLIKNFDTIWIPDSAEESNLSGKLSHPIPHFVKKYEYIGALSRMKHREMPQKKYDVCVVLSGPEPQRTYLENILLPQMLALPQFSFLLVRGVTISGEATQYKNIKTIHYLTTNELNEAMLSSRYIIARSGYSTLMDLMKIQKKAILIPTPGQTEQEYLAHYFVERYGFLMQNQKDIKLKDLLIN